GIGRFLPLRWGLVQAVEVRSMKRHGRHLLTSLVLLVGVCIIHLDEVRPLAVWDPQPRQGLDDAETNFSAAIIFGGRGLAPCILHHATETFLPGSGLTDDNGSRYAHKVFDSRFATPGRKTSSFESPASRRTGSIGCAR